MGAGAWYFWAQRSADEQAADSTAFMVPKVPVRITQVTEGELQERLRAIGTVEAFNIVTVRRRVEGDLLETYCEYGQFVEAGDVVAQVDPEPYELRLDQSKGQYKQSQAQLDIAKTDLHRFRTLYEQDSLAKQTLEYQEALVAQLEGTVQSAQAAIQEAELQLKYTIILAHINGNIGFKQLDDVNHISTGNLDGVVTIDRKS